MNFTRLIVASNLLASVLNCHVFATGNERTYEISHRGVTLFVISQRRIQDKVPYVGDDVIDFSDLIVKFRLKNAGTEEIYFQLITPSAGALAGESASHV
jgi:hypothetical protein